MFVRSLRRPVVAVLVGSALLAGCSAAPTTPTWTYGPVDPPATVAPATSGNAMAHVVEVHRDAFCSCCHEWEAYMREAGWEVRSVEEADMAEFKAAHDLPQSAWSCHTALIGGYVVEGHVPLAAIEDLLEQAPPIDGIALAGMPAGSPGMPGAKEGPFDVVSVTDGVTDAFGAY